MIRLLEQVCGTRRAIAFALLAIGASGCSTGTGDPQALSGPTPALITETFSGSIQKNSANVHSFAVTSSGSPLLAGFTSISPASVSTLGLGLGVWDTATSTCGLNQSQTDSAHIGSTALNGTADSGSYCVRIYDSGGIPDNTTAEYSVQVQHY